MQLLFILKESASFKIKNAPRDAHKKGASSSCERDLLHFGLIWMHEHLESVMVDSLFECTNEFLCGGKLL